jgi:hypothetical protein
MEKGDLIRITLTIQATVNSPGGLMELGRCATERMFAEKDWTEEYPRSLEDAILTILSRAVFQETGIEEVIDIHSLEADIDKDLPPAPVKAKT